MSNRGHMRLDDLPPKMRAEAEAQLGAGDFVGAGTAKIIGYNREDMRDALDTIKDTQAGGAGVAAVKTDAKPRLRQKRGAKLNKTEAAFLEWLKANYRIGDPVFYAQEITLQLANGLRYTPDFVMSRKVGHVAAFEVKGFMRDDAAAKLKMAASKYPWISFFLVTAEDRSLREWNIEEVLP